MKIERRRDAAPVEHTGDEPFEFICIVPIRGEAGGA
jgi:hypothetical protein